MGLAELVEQRRLRVPARLVNCEIEQLHLDMPLSLTWMEYEGIPVPAFELGH